MRKIYRRGPSEPERMTDARQKVLNTLAEYGDLSFTLKELAELAGVASSVVKGLVEQGAVAEEDSPRDLPFPRLDPSLPSKELTEDQATASAYLADAVQSGNYGTTLLRGGDGGRVRPKFTWRPSPPHCELGGRRWCCCLRLP